MKPKSPNLKASQGKPTWRWTLFRNYIRIEAQIKGSSADEKQQIRQQQAQPLLNEFKDWLDKSVDNVPQQTTLGKAIGYTLRQWPKLIRYIVDGKLNIDNNRAERAIKPFVIGRKNWLFSNTANGAKASATLYSIIETAKANGIVPFDYLMYLLEQLSQSDYKIDQLLPWAFARR